MSVVIGYAVATAYVNQPSAVVVKPSPVDAASVAVNYGTLGVNRKPVDATAISVEAANQAPPTVSGQQLQFFWG